MISTTWTPEQVVAVVGSLTTFVGTLIGGTIAVLKVIKGARETTNNAIDSMRESVPAHLVTTLVSNGIATANNAAVSLTAAATTAAASAAPAIEDIASHDPEEGSQS